MTVVDDLVDGTGIPSSVTGNWGNIYILLEEAWDDLGQVVVVLL